MTLPIRALIVTYSVLANTSGHPSMIGVLKRCLRLAERLPPGLVEGHLVNFGTLPAADPLVTRVVNRLVVHQAPNTRPGCRELCRALRPDVVVLGEGPGGGMMGAMARAASLEGIPMVCVENLYGTWQPHRFANASPTVSEWLLLGLPMDGRDYGRWSERVVVAPPLLSPPVQVTILGYDPMVAERGLALVDRLPRGTRARLVGARAAAARAAAGRAGR
ncbi:MAG TPA: hypothetical protein VHG28_23170, partial [Longimicrobiaceae bacterium]|nr:hypothetical protein [Longimicrobiaceae bacterium]